MLHVVHIASPGQFSMPQSLPLLDRTVQTSSASKAIPPPEIPHQRLLKSNGSRARWVPWHIQQLSLSIWWALVFVLTEFNDKGDVAPLAWQVSPLPASPTMEHSPHECLKSRKENSH